LWTNDEQDQRIINGKYFADAFQITYFN
jgi:hypothetical protein